MVVAKEAARVVHDPWKNRIVMCREVRDDLNSDKSSGVSSISRSGRPSSFAVSSVMRDAAPLSSRTTEDGISSRA